MRNPLSLAAALILSVSALAAADANFLDAYAPPHAAPNATIHVIAAVLNSSNSNQYLPNYNIMASLNASNSTNTTNDSAPLVLNLTVPITLYGEQNITVYDNTTDSQSKNFSIYVTNVSNATFEFTNKFPPFSAGSSFTINVTLRHANGSLMPSSYSLNSLSAEVFSANSNETSGWGVTNLSNIDATGTVQYNITVPSAADGQYALVVDRGAGFLMFMVSYGYIVAVNTQSAQGDTTSDFAQNEAVSILAKIRDSASDPVTGATSVVARITLPNSTELSVSLAAPNDSLFPGFYNGTYTAVATGNYQIRVDAAVSGHSLVSYGGFSVKPYISSLGQESDFFKDWGGLKAISPNSQVGFNLVVTNLSSGAQAEGYLNADNSSAFNCSTLGSSAALANISLYYSENDTLFNASVNTTFANATDNSNRVCRLVFSAPARAGSYIARIPMRFMGYTANATGFFSVQNFFLKVRPTSSFGGGEFFQVFSPGGNVTFDVSAFNLSGNAAINGSNISAISVRRITPLMFGSGGTTNANISSWSSAANSTSPQVIVTLPANTTGPILIDVQAMIGNYSLASTETVTGNAMVLAKYIDGFLSPQSAGGPEGQQAGGPPSASCSGNVTFSGMVRDIRINQNAQGVIVNGVSELREEMTERDVAKYGCVSASSTVSNSTSSGNNLQFNATFATPNATCPQMSGFYFMIVNVSYQGNIDFLPAGFQCRTLQFFPQITSGGQDAWQVSPTAGVTVNVSGAKLGAETITSGNITILRLMNFNPSTGPTMYPASALSNLTTQIIAGTSAINVSPGNFTDGSGQNLSRWPNGFVGLQVRTCTSGNVCDTAEGGFQVVSFNAFNNMMGSGQYYPGENVVIDILASTNVSSNRTASPDEIQGTNLTGFSITVGRPWEGQVVTATLNSVLNNSDGWNSSADQGWQAVENWTINFTIPANAPAGNGQMMITVNNTYGETVDVYRPFQMTRYQVKIPSEEGVAVYSDSMMMRQPSDIYDGTTGQFRVNDSGVFNAAGAFVAKSQSGRYCLKMGFNTTRYGMQQQNVDYNQSWRMLVVDNTTASNYDTIIVNESSVSTGRVWWANSSNRSIAGNTTLKLWNIFDCAYFSVVSSVAPLQDFNNWGGTHQVNQSFALPYIVKQAGAAVAGASVGVANVILQNQMGSGQGSGSGFAGLLTEGVDYNVHQQATTDANGLGFLNISFTRSGSFMLFWNMTAGSDSDAASFDSGTFVEVRNFDAYGQPAAMAPKVVRLQNASNGSAGGSPSGNWTAIDYYGAGLNLTIFNLTQINAGLAEWFIGTFNESANGTLANEGGANANLSTWYFAWNPASNVIVLDDDNNFTRVQGAQNDGSGDNYTVMQSSLNDSICLASGECGNGALQLKAMRAFNNWTNSTFGSAANYSLVAFVQETQGEGNGGNFAPATSSSNVTGKVCAQTFGKPGTPIQNANVTFYLQQWGMNGQKTQNLTVYDPLNDTVVTQLPTGPLGCVAAKIKAPDSGDFPSGWPQGGQGGGPGEIRATIYNGTSMETSWVNMVQFFG